jgi:hypothetical protein
MKYVQCYIYSHKPYFVTDDKNVEKPEVLTAMVIKSKSCKNPAQSGLQPLFQAGFLCGLPFNHEDIGNMFL